MNKKLIMLLFIILLLFLTGCGKLYNRSEEKVEGGLPIYQQLLLLY